MKKKRWVNCIVAAAFALLGVGLWIVPGVRFSALLSFGLAGISLVWLLLGFCALSGSPCTPHLFITV